MVTESKQSGVKKAVSSQLASSSKGKLDASAAKKTAENSRKQPTPGSKSKAVTKSEVKTKATSTSSKTTTATTSTKVREKKVYSLPGQKYDPPEEREPLRIFYESLSKQIPTSEMAEFWLMERGLLSPEGAKRAFEKKQRKQKEIRMGTPTKSPPKSTKPESSKKQQPSRNGEIKAKKRMITDDDDDLILSPKRRKV